MVRPDRQLLHGKVEVDESYLGGEEEGVSGRYTEKKALVVIAVEIHDPKGFGRIRMRWYAIMAPLRPTRTFAEGFCLASNVRPPRTPASTRLNQIEARVAGARILPKNGCCKCSASIRRIRANSSASGSTGS